MLHITLNGVRLPALYDSGAASTCISLGLAKAAGFTISRDYTGGVKGVEGKGQAIAGALVGTVFHLHRDLTIRTSHTLVLPLEAPLLLLGNDIFGNNEHFSFLSLKTNRKKPILEVLNKVS